MNFKRFHESKNLFNYKRDKATTFTTDTKYYMIGAASVNDVNVGASVTITDSGVKVTSTIAGYGASFFIEVTPNTDYTISVSCNKVSSGSYFSYSCRDASGNVISGSPQSAPTTTQTITAPANAKFLNICLRFPPSDGEVEYTNVMLNTGSTPLPYEPYSSEVWHDIPYYIHKTDTDTIATLPADIYANDTTATVGLKGNMEQSGTPTPSSPIQPQECGERTENHFNAEKVVAGRLDNGVIGYAADTSNVQYSNNVLSFTISKAFRGVTSDLIPIDDVMCISYTLSSGMIKKVAWYASDKSFISQAEHNSQTYLTGMVLTPIENAKYFRISFEPNAAGDYTITNTMLNTDSTPLPYEPYGIKIPILSANTTTPVYLGEVESTRRIKKWVLTGNENWDRQMPQHTTVINLYCPVTGATPNSPIVSNIALYSPEAGGNNDSYVNVGKINTGGTNLLLDLSLSDFSTTGAFKSYLQQQYANGTPVTIWYVLATPTTGIVNEPLRKIGDYADAVSGITIPTTAGANTISVDTTLQPSEVSVNYKGWHPIADVHKRESGAWT